jgi:hypothetical protein
MYGVRAGVAILAGALAGAFAFAQPAFAFAQPAFAADTTPTTPTNLRPRARLRPLTMPGHPVIAGRPPGDPTHTDLARSIPGMHTA